jgi:hypothetical protein
MRVKLAGTWGADIEAREARRDHLLMRAWSRPLKQPVECSICHRAITVGWLREDGVYFCCREVEVEDFELLCKERNQ